MRQPLCVKAFIAVYLVMLLSGCASLAPQTMRIDLDATPGPPVLVTDDRYTTVAFSVMYPAGWRAVSSAAFSEPYVVFVSPDEDVVIGVAVDAQDIAEIGPPNLPDDGTPLIITNTVELADDSSVSVRAVASPETTLAYGSLVAQLERSLRPPE